MVQIVQDDHRGLPLANLFEKSRHRVEQSEARLLGLQGRRSRETRNLRHDVCDELSNNRCP